MVRRDLIRNILLALIVILMVILFRIFFFSTFKVTDDSSNHYLASGDIVTIAKQRSPLVRDFVVYEVDGKEYMGRIIAKEGQEVTSMDDVLYVDHKVNKEPYLKKDKNHFLKTAQADHFYTEDFSINSLNGNDKTNTIAKDSYLILNDNRQNKQDSRSFGLIKKSQIKGVASTRIWPLDKFGFISVE